MSTPKRSNIVSRERDSSNMMPKMCLKNLAVLNAMLALVGITLLCNIHKSVILIGMSFCYAYGVAYNINILKQTDPTYLQELPCIQTLRNICVAASWVLIEFYLWFLQFLETSLSLFMSLYDNYCATEARAEETRTNEVKTPDVIKNAVSEILPIKSNSEPLKPPFAHSIPNQIKPRRTSINRVSITRTPELFKNKIYQTRRTLINTQNELFNDKVNTF